MWHDVTRKGLTEAAIEKRTFRHGKAKVRVVPTTDLQVSPLDSIHLIPSPNITAELRMPTRPKRIFLEYQAQYYEFHRH
jgi:hypothetical protein